ncbi:DegT/DnrJ/EryC1/StrS family aminotransferase [Nonlabens xiamenensis]|uniref:DegT/DnrJ/EryC1/StrS family aminotransferase n=1 Tax=Nonlabens xiamenensis TaxID=2341043 RepID=UPI000F6070E2|nr:DegT/DnrJ/EryC1/StrS family aminotransferase [Nonlabens xiamenensis]
MSKPRIYISTPHLDGNEGEFLALTLDSNWIAPVGVNITNFERELSKYLSQGKEVTALNCGTAAVHLALLLAGVEAGDEVICQSFTFCASANPILYVNATPVFVDSEKQTWNMCPELLKSAVEDRIARGKKPKAIIAVHSYGMPYKVDEVHAFAKAHQIPVIEDSAEALGSTYKGRKCGTYGDFGILSFNGNKIITTSGGGALVCPDQSTKQKTVFLATQARDQAPHYQHSQLGYNYRMSNISAGIGRGQMQVLDKHVELRRRMNSFYKDLFKEIDGINVLEEPSADFHSNHWLSAILVEPSLTGGITREDLRVALEKDNIESRPLWKPMHLQPLYKDYPYYGHGVCDSLFDKGLCLPSGSNLTDTDRERIANAILTVFKDA